GDRRRQHVGRDVATGVLTTTRGLQGDLVGRVLHGLAAVDVVERRNLGADREVPDEAGQWLVGVLLQLVVEQDLRLRRRLHTGLREVDVERAINQLLVDLI